MRSIGRFVRHWRGALCPPFVTKMRLAHKQPRGRRPTERFADGSPQEIVLRAALIDLFDYQGQGLRDPGAWRWTFYWMAPVWVSYLYLLLGLVGAHLHGQGADADTMNTCVSALSLSSLAWLVLALAFTLHQLRFIRSAHWTIREKDRDWLPAQIAGRIKTSTLLPERLAGFVAQTAFGLIYVASLGVYQIALQILKP
jgi:hypothetical protein